jgi:hypothetical protein
VPVFVPRKKLIFRKTPLVIGTPYRIEKQKGKRTADDYAGLADVLMDKIKSLNPAAGGAG